MRRLTCAIALTLFGLVQLPAAGQQPAPTPTTAPAGPGRGGMLPETEPDDVAGFVSIFDGKTLTGWEGDQTFWRADGGSIVGETTPEKVVKLNNFLIWRGGTVKDFELKVEFRLSGTNSGIQYRSVELPTVGKWVLKGYQADLDFTEGFVGNIHDERGRSPSGEGHVILSPRGQATRIVDGPKYKVLGKIGDPTLLRRVMNVNGWNRYHIIARGPIIPSVPQQPIDERRDRRRQQARRCRRRSGFQMHTGPPFKIECPKRDVSKITVTRRVKPERRQLNQISTWLRSCQAPRRRLSRPLLLQRVPAGGQRSAVRRLTETNRAARRAAGPLPESPRVPPCPCVSCRRASVLL